MATATASRSAIPVFMFLGLVLLFIPAVALICIWIHRRRDRLRSEQSRAETAERVAENLYRWSKAAPIEMDTLNLQPPPSVAIKPIRGMAVGKVPRLYTQSALGQQDPSYDRPLPTIPSAPHTPARLVESNTHQAHGGTPTSASPHQTPLPDVPASAPPHSPRYNLQAALGSEASPATVRTGCERKASFSNAPRVKSLKVRPEYGLEAIHGAERPALPEFETAYFAQGQQQDPARSTR